MAKFKHVESKKYKGFYVSKPYPNVLVSKKGEILRLTANAKTGPVGSKTYGYKNSKGYMVISTFSKLSGKNDRTVRVHWVAAFAFYGHPKKGLTQVNHKDKVRDNNEWTNLEWISMLDNIKHQHGIPALECLDYLYW